MALNTKFGVFVQVMEKTIINNKVAYRIIMPSGLITIAWATDLFFV